jgi:peptide-methionine (S)-S-oxide reductase
LSIFWGQNWYHFILKTINCKDTLNPLPFRNELWQLIGKNKKGIFLRSGFKLGIFQDFYDITLFDGVFFPNVKGVFMKFYFPLFLFVICVFALLACNSVDTSARTAQVIPETVPLLTDPGEQTAVFAGGCFWGVDAVYKHVKGVKEVKSGYAGGTSETADYETVSSGQTGHAESVRIIFDPSQVTYQQLLKVFFYVAHNPTELNRQGPDRGMQYRSAIFYADDAQKQTAQNYIKELTGAKVFKQSIVTEINPLEKFYPAEDYHQNYLALHPDDPYIVYNDLPKLDDLRKKFPDLYVSK